jgi:hypothetical protein
MSDEAFKKQLVELEESINQAIDKLIPLRDSAKFEGLRNSYRRTGRRLESALGMVHAAQDLMGVRK